ncbi:MAG: 2-C-methyl-D-erythritol 2,4-cyclodiphosphate synthase, partial [Pseudomonadales bacterium]|nr:2-C-methyl-D-erythritol 2,4-cyclodiphosphate synthase [Pseudomonadales bacterium]
LGALALGDIGQHFPDTDARYANANSRDLLRAVMQLVAQHGYRLGNADMTIVAQQPRMAPYVAAMRENISCDTNASLEAISVKATTSEKLGFTGRGEGLACFAVVLLEALRD